MDRDSFYLAMSDDSLDKIVKPEIKQVYEADEKNWLATDKFSERTSDLFKPEFVGTRGVWLTAKGYLVQNEALNIKQNIGAKAFQRSIIIYIFSAIKISWMFF